MTYPISTEPEGPITDDNGDELEHGEPDAAPPVEVGEHRPADMSNPLDAAWEALVTDLHLDDADYDGTVDRHRPHIEAALRSAAPALDVERLARALRLSVGTPASHQAGAEEWSLREAADIAREYAALEGASGE